ncbi:translocation channel protein [Starmerella bacillaris]|mgnify:CR=1 FL=1|uniref:Mitochondrial import inner membrane translocase subunit TIM22 n=1 Tax=Starmerella bacillaris TaxID=1247836 RepID=A0AAV5RF92_STABA|nr:translocation channel protein [Starmerella bacillaris]
MSKAFPGFEVKPPKKEFAEMTVEEQAEAGALAMVEFMHSCPGKTAAAGIMGFGLGGVFGIFMSSLSYETASGYSDVSKIAHLPFKQQMKIQFTDMFKRSYSSAKNFGKVGGLYTGVECCIESLRAKNDMYNSLSAGAITGAGLAIRSGPIGAGMGAVGFALFSLAIETYLRSDHTLPPANDQDW